MTQKPTKLRHNNNNKNKKQPNNKSKTNQEYSKKKKQSSKIRNKSMTIKLEQTVMYLHEARKQQQQPNS